MRLVFWTKEYNYHWDYVYKNLASLLNGRVTVIVQNDLSEYRKRVGWSSQANEGFVTKFITRRDWFSQAPGFIRENRDAIHFFLGFTGKWCTFYILPLILLSIMQGVKSIVMVEHYSKSAAGYFRDEPSIISQIKVGLRPIIYKTSVGIMKMFAKNNSLYFLAQSPLAKQVMVKAGIDPRSIFCFGYFIPKDASVKTVEKTFHKPINAIYVGSMIKRKGVDLVIDALADINSKQKIYQLDIYGPGSFKLLPRHEAHGVTFKGILPQDQVQKTIAKYDLLILPSRHDGWGVVVNEALLQGVPVLVSDEAGASCLVKAMQAGMLFISGDKNDLKSKLLIFNDRKLLQEFRSNAQEVGNMITPDIAAKYLLEVLQFFFESDQRGNFPRAIWSEDL